METSAEIHFAQKLASNEKKIRDRALKRLQKYLFVRSSKGGFSEEDLTKIWKGLHYCMWMQDKPLVQEELSQRITKLLHSFPKCRDALLFGKVFMATQAREWNFIDKFRIDKFMMLVRDMLHETFALLSRSEWPYSECEAFSAHLEASVMEQGNSKLPDGLKLHFADIYVEELGKVPLSGMDTRKLLLLLRPFIHFVLSCPKMDLVKRIMSDVIKKAVLTLTASPREDEASSEKKEGGEEEEEEEEDEEDMEVDEKEAAFKIDESVFFLSLLLASERKDVRQPNRAVVYSFVKSRPQVYSTVVKLKEEIQECPGQMESLDHKDLQFLSEFGKARDTNSSLEKKKKRRGKKRKMRNDEEEEEEETGEEVGEEVGIYKTNGKSKGSISSNKSGSSDENLTSSSPKKKLKKEKVLAEVVDSASNESIKNKETQASNELSQKNKKQHSSPKSKTAASNSNNNSIRTSDAEERVVLSQDNEAEGGEEGRIENSNSNGRKSQMSDITLNMPMEFVRYAQTYDYISKKRVLAGTPVIGPSPLPISKLPNSVFDVDENDGTYIGAEVDGDNHRKNKKKSSSPGKARKGSKKKNMLRRSEDLSDDESSTDSRVLKRKGKKTKKGLPYDGGEESEDMSAVDDSSGAADAAQSDSLPSVASLEGHSSVPGAISSNVSSVTGISGKLLDGPFNLIKNSISSVTSSVLGHAGASPMDLSGKKKVVFDLKKNTANKFKDYVKSLQSADLPAIPSSSSSPSILKTTPSQSSESLSSESVSTETSPRSRRKAGKKNDRTSLRRASAPGRYNLNKVKRKGVKAKAKR